MLKLRNYQSHALKLLREAFKGGNKRIILQLSCGGGKTEVAAQIIINALALGKRVVFTVNKIVLAEQASERLDKYGIKHGIWQAQNERFAPHLPCQVASLQTLANRKPLENVDIFIVDESHVYSGVLEKLRAYNPEAIFIGLTATPYSILAPWWQKLVVAVSMQKLMDKGYVVPYRVYAAPTADLSKVKIVAGEFQNKSLAEATDKPKLTGSIIQEWKRRGENRQTIVFSVNRAHAKHIELEFQNNGITAVSIDCYTDATARMDAFRDFNNCDTRVLVSVMVLTTGADFPIASCAIFACATKSRCKHVQSLGRVLRPCDGKEDAICIDHGGNFERLGFPEEYYDEELDDGKRAKQKKQDAKDMSEALPKACQKCSFIKPPVTHKCPNCGFEPEHIQDVEFEAGKLVEFRKRRANRVDSKEFKQEFYSGLLSYAANHGHKEGFAAHKYRARYSVWPNAMAKKRGPITLDVTNWIKHEAIKRRYERAG